jgi:hypothetical protein
VGANPLDHLVLWPVLSRPAGAAKPYQLGHVPVLAVQRVERHNGVHYWTVRVDAQHAGLADRGGFAVIREPPQSGFTLCCILTPTRATDVLGGVADRPKVFARKFFFISVTRSLSSCPLVITQSPA